MIVQVKRFDFVKGVVTLHPRIIPDELPETPLTAMLKKRRPTSRPLSVHGR